MPDNDGYKALSTEWRQIIMSLKFHRSHIDSIVDDVKDDDEQNSYYDDLERLNFIIADIERELKYEDDELQEYVDKKFGRSEDAA